MKSGLTLEIRGIVWSEVLTITKGTKLVKGRTSDVYRQAILKSREVLAERGCYSWMVGNQIAYCGSFSPYARFQTALEGRVHNYLQNHRQTLTRMNTNLWVFTRISEALQEANVSLCHLQFDSLHLNGQSVAQEEFTGNPTLILAVEASLIASLKFRQHCGWNRT